MKDKVIMTISMKVKVITIEDKYESEGDNYQRSMTVKVLMRVCMKVKVIFRPNMKVKVVIKRKVGEVFWELRGETGFANSC